MIKKLNIFSENTYVVAEEWNANFSVLNQSNQQCSDAIADANQQLAFPDSDLTQLFQSVNSRQNSFNVVGTNVLLQPECEYYKTLAGGESLTVNVPKGMNATARVIVKINDDRDLPPIIISEYEGEKIVTGLDRAKFASGCYFAFILERQDTLIVKIKRQGE